MASMSMSLETILVVSPFKMKFKTRIICEVTIIPNHMFATKTCQSVSQEHSLYKLEKKHTHTYKKNGSSCKGILPLVSTKYPVYH